MRKPFFFAYAKTKGADQLRGSREADQPFCFRYIDSTIPLLPKYEISISSHLVWLYNLVCVGPGWKAEDRFSHNKAQLTTKITQESNLCFPVSK